MARIKDLDNEGVWGEVMYPSLGIWTFNVRTPRVVKEGCRALNDWALDFQQHSPRFVCVASIPLVDIDDAVAEVKRAHEVGFLCGFLPVRPPARPARVERRGVGPAVGRLRRDGHGDRVPHRDRAPRPHASAPASTTGGGAAPSSTTSRPPTAASGPSPS